MEHLGETNLTEAMHWLIERHGLVDLHPDEIDAIRDFTLLWALFEGKAMATYGSPAKVVAAVDRMDVPDQLPDRIVEALQYWRHRYVDADDAAERFAGLRFRDNAFRSLTLAVLNGQREGPVDVLKALLLITLRLRNNLFHGVKWQYLLVGQRGNFDNANAVLMTATEMAVPLP